MGVAMLPYLAGPIAGLAAGLAQTEGSTGSTQLEALALRKRAGVETDAVAVPDRPAWKARARDRADESLLDPSSLGPKQRAIQQAVEEKMARGRRMRNFFND